MNAIENGKAGSTGNPKNVPSPPAGYEWTCPYCGKSRLNRSGGEDAARNAVAALRTHIYATDGGEHGSRNEYPTDEPLPLSDYVVEVEDRR